MEREKFVQEVNERLKSISQLCREYGISRPTAYKWLGRACSGEGLGDRSKAPFRTPNKTGVEIEQLVLSMRDKHHWGARKIHKVLGGKVKVGLPTKGTINAILRRNGRISTEASAAATRYKRFNKDTCNEMWQMDFKGHFLLENGVRCHPLVVVDDCSRYMLALDAKANERREGVEESLKQLFYRYGRPKSILCDNGNPWGASQSTGYTTLEVWLMDLDILPIHGRPRHPQTQGKCERLNQSIKRELLKWEKITDMQHAQNCFDKYCKIYNTERPHEALDMEVPANKYEKSDSAYSEEVLPYKYEEGVELRQIKSSGYLTYGGQGYFLSEAFVNKEVGIRKTEKEGELEILYRNFVVAVLSPKNRAIISRRIRRDKKNSCTPALTSPTASFTQECMTLTKTVNHVPNTNCKPSYT